MIKIFIATYGDVSFDLATQTEAMVGVKTTLTPLSFKLKDSIDKCIKKLEAAISDHKEVVILTDLIGTNLNKALIQKKYLFITGVNLSMSISAAKCLIKAEFNTDWMFTLLKKETVNSIVTSNELGV